MAPGGRAGGPRDSWRSMVDRAAAAGNSLCVRACVDAGMGDYFLELSLQCISPELVESPPRVALEDFPSVRHRPVLAAAEMDRLTAMLKISWCPGGCCPRVSECARLN